MTNPSFLAYLRVLDETVEDEVSKITADIAMVDSQINKATAPLVARKTQLQKLLAVKQKLAQNAASQHKPTIQQATPAAPAPVVGNAPPAV